MWEGLAGALVGAGAKLLPNLFGDTSDKKAEAQFNANYELQQRALEHGTLIKARDVMRAYEETGLHPLALLGAGAAAPSPVAMVGDTGPSGWKKGLSDAGQDIGRAISASAGAEERKLLLAANLARMNAETDLFKARTASEMARLNQPAVGPPMALPSAPNFSVPGQGDVDTELRSPIGKSSLVKNEPLKRVIPMPGSPYSEPGEVTSLRWSRTPTGWAPIKSKDTQEGLEDDWIGNIWWNVANRFIPSIRTMARIKHHGTPPVALPEGYTWHFDLAKGEYQMVRKRAHTAYEGPIKY